MTQADPGDLAAAMEDFRAELEALKALWGVTLSQQEARLRTLDARHPRTLPDGAVSGSRNNINLVYRSPMTQLPDPARLRGFLFSLGVTQDEREDWEKRRQELVRWKQAGDRAPAGPDGVAASVATIDRPIVVPGGSTVEGPARRRRRRPLAVGAVVVVLGLLTVLGVVFLRSPAEPLVAVTGRVVCVSGAAVVGVFIEADGRGFARWTAVAGDPSTADFVHDLPRGARYSVRVGCGGTPQKWATEDRSDEVDRAPIVFTCSEAPRGGLGYCAATAP